MSNESIRSKVESIDSVVRKYAEDISVFQSEVDDGMRNLDSSMGRLSSVWAGTLHDNFAEKMRERQTRIRSNLRRAGLLRDDLNVISQKMAVMLERLNKASEDL
jgi:uncharacterized protein YukE